MGSHAHHSQHPCRCQCHRPIYFCGHDWVLPRHRRCSIVAARPPCYQSRSHGGTAVGVKGFELTLLAFTRLTLVVGQCELADYNSQPKKSAIRVIIVHRSESEGQPTLSAAPASDQAALPATLGPGTQPLQPRAKAPRPAQTQRDQETSCHTTANESAAWLLHWSSIREPTRPVPDATRPATVTP